MTEALSQDEIDDLLNAISSGDNPARGGEEGDAPPRSERRRVKVYDFKRPSKFSKEQMRTVSMMHETFARLTTTSLSAQLRSLVHVHVAAVDELTYDEFIRSLSTPTTTAVINMDPLKGSAVLELDPTITFSILDRLLGGQGVSLANNRELSDIEASVAEMIIVRILGNMREAWNQVVDLRPRLSHIETNPQFVQIVPPGEMVVLITLEARVEKAEGIINLCIPYMTLEPIISKLSSQFWYSSASRQTSAESLRIMEERIKTVPIRLSVIIGQTELTTRELISLQAGHVLVLPKASVKKPLTFCIGSKPKYHCRPGMVNNKISVEILKRLEEVHEVDIDDLIIGGGEDE